MVIIFLFQDCDAFCWLVKSSNRFWADAVQCGHPYNTVHATKLKVGMKMKLFVQKWTIFPDSRDDVKQACLNQWRHFLVTECSLKHYRHHISEARPDHWTKSPNELNAIKFGGKRTLKTLKLPKNKNSDWKTDENMKWLRFY